MDKSDTMRPATRWTVLLLSGIVLILVLALVASRDPREVVQVVRVTRTTLSASITNNGKVEPIDPRVYRAEFSTFVANISATEGQPIHTGQTIVKLDSTDVTAQLVQARGDLLTARHDLRDARAGGPPDEVTQVAGDLKRARMDVETVQRKQEILKNLLAKQAAMQDELDQNGAALARAQASLQMLEKKSEDLHQRATLQQAKAALVVEQLEGQIQALQKKVHSATVIAPMDGTLYSLPIRHGDYVQVGQVLAELADLRKVRVRAFVDEPDMAGLEPNQPVQITWDAMANKTWSGLTEQIPKQVVARGTRSVGEVLSSVNNEKLELLPNINVNVRIQVHESQETLAVPRGAVHSDQTRRYVFVLSGDRLRRRSVVIGIANASSYEVLTGLAEGDRVALRGDRELFDGMLVRANESK